MTLTLREAISAGQTTIAVNGADTLRVGSFRQLGDEVLGIRAVKRPTLQPGQAVWQLLSVERGIENSEPVVHAAAVEMTTYAGGTGGGLSADNTVDPPEDVTSLVSAGAVIGSGVVTLRGKDFYAQDTDPGAVGTGSVWKDTSASFPYNWWERNSTDDGWDAIATIVVTGAGSVDAEANLTVESVDGDADAQTLATAVNGAANASIRADTAGSSNATVNIASNANGDGDANALTNAYALDGTASVDRTAEGTGAFGYASADTTATGSFGADASVRAIRAGVEAGMKAEVDATSARLGFNGATPIAKPAITGSRGANAALASLLTALANLGLITDSTS